VGARKSRGEATTVLTGTFVTTGFTAIDTKPQLGDARNGPYRSFYEEIQPLPSRKTDLTGRDLPGDSRRMGLTYPARGVEVEISTGVESNNARYESFFPAQPYRLYADGWAWLIPAPGSPIGMQITDTHAEDALRRRSEIAGLVTGILLALCVQVAYELLRSVLRGGEAKNGDGR
jgi:hypothetical protein